MASILSEKEKVEIRKLYATGRYSYKKLAEQFFVSTRTIGKAVRCEPREENKKYTGYFRKPEKHKVPMRKKFDRKRVVRNLIEAMSEYSLMDNWTELYLMEMMLSCGLLKEDFEEAGYIDFYNEFFEGAV